MTSTTANAPPASDHHSHEMVNAPAFDHSGPGGPTAGDEVWGHFMVGRYGLVILRFDPDAQYGQRLERVGYLRIPSGMGGMRVRDEGGGQGTLVINESTHGLRSYRYPN